MLRDSRIVHIIDLLGELRELLLVIDQAGDTAPAILLKLAKEKDTEDYSESPIIENNEPTHENDTEENEEENNTLYPWEKLNGEKLSAVQDENNDEYEDSNEFDEDMEEDYEEPDLYEEENTEEIIEEEEPATPVTLEEALQRQQAK